MCVTATVNGSSVDCECRFRNGQCLKVRAMPPESQMSSRVREEAPLVGWACKLPSFVSQTLKLMVTSGFGQHMPNTPMVIMWSNSDGSITLSQRSAPTFVMPTVDDNPPRHAILEQALSSVSLHGRHLDDCMLITLKTTSGNTRFAFSIPVCTRVVLKDP